jgi:hypothetical protein
MYYCHAEAFLYRICTERCGNNGGIFMLFRLSCESQNINKKSDRCLVRELMIFELDESGLLKASLVVVIS